MEWQLIIPKGRNSGHGRNESQQSSNTMKAYANGSISHQYFFDTNYFHLLLGLRSFQKSEQYQQIIFWVKYLKNLCELDTRAIACNFQAFGIFSFFSNFFRQNSFIFELKVEKKDMGVFSTQFVPLISILATKILTEQNCQL